MLAANASGAGARERLIGVGQGRFKLTHPSVEARWGNAVLLVASSCINRAGIASF